MLRIGPVLMLLSLVIAGCAERPRIGVDIGSQKVQDCVPGSLSRPCN